MTASKLVKDIKARIAKHFRIIKDPATGEEIAHRPMDELGALSAAIDGEEHFLLPAMRAQPKGSGVADIIKAIDSSRARHASKEAPLESSAEATRKTAAEDS